MQIGDRTCVKASDRDDLISWVHLLSNKQREYVLLVALDLLLSEKVVDFVHTDNLAEAQFVRNGCSILKGSAFAAVKPRIKRMQGLSGGSNGEGCDDKKGGFQ